MKNQKQETALDKAAAAGCLELMELLLKLESNESWCNSSGCVHPEGYHLEGGRLNLDALWKAQNVHGETALHYAVKGGNVEIASLLLEKVKGVELIVNKDGESALYTSCLQVMVSFPPVKKLGDIESISETRSIDKKTCLHQLLINSARPSGSAVSFLLRKRPALAKMEDDSGNAPLHLASIGGTLEIVEELLKGGPEMALQKNNDDMAAIHYAARMGRTDIVRCLIERVPHCVEMLGKDNKTALHFALEYGNTSTARTLLSESMDPSFLINHADNDGQTAVHKAASSSQLVILIYRMLRISRWNANAVHKNGLAPMDVLIDKSKDWPWMAYGWWLHKYGCYVTAHARIDFLLKMSRPFLEVSPKEEDGGVQGTPKKQYSEVVKEGGENLLVVATLVFTLSFAAALTVPGGLQSDNSSPVRMHSTALHCFTAITAPA